MGSRTQASSDRMPGNPEGQASSLLETFPRALHHTAKNWKRLMDERLRGLGLSQPRWMVLLYLSQHPQGMMQRELADWMDIECASLAGLLDRMAADGWIERRPCKTDRRANLVFLSAKSTATLGEIRRVAAQVTRDLLAGVPACDLQACRDLLDAINERAQALSSAASED